MNAKRVTTVAVTSVMAAATIASATMVAREPVASVEPPKLKTDATTPMFKLYGLRGGEQRQSCIAVMPSGGEAQYVQMSAIGGGSLAERLLLRVEAGASAGGLPGATHSCGSFVPERTLFTGRLSSFPGGTNPATDPVKFNSVKPRLYRLSVEFPTSSADGTDGTGADYGFFWTAAISAPKDPQPEPEPDPQPDPQPQPDPDPQPETEDERDRKQLVTLPGHESSPDRCRTLGATRYQAKKSGVTLLVGGNRTVTSDEPLLISTQTAGGKIKTVTYTSSVGAIKAGGARPWPAALPVARLKGGSGLTVTAKVTPKKGKPFSLSVTATMTDCPSRLVAKRDRKPNTVMLRLDAIQPVNGLTLDLGKKLAAPKPKGTWTITAADRTVVSGAVAVKPAVGKPSVVLRGTKAEVSNLPAGAGQVVLRLQYSKKTFNKLLPKNRCVRYEIKAAVSGKYRIEKPFGRLRSKLTSTCR